MQRGTVKVKREGIDSKYNRGTGVLGKMPQREKSGATKKKLKKQTLPEPGLRGGGGGHRKVKVCAGTGTRVAVVFIRKLYACKKGDKRTMTGRRRSQANDEKKKKKIGRGRKKKESILSRRKGKGRMGGKRGSWEGIRA